MKKLLFFLIAVILVAIGYLSLNDEEPETPQISEAAATPAVQQEAQPEPEVQPKPEVKPEPKPVARKAASKPKLQPKPHPKPQPVDENDHLHLKFKGVPINGSLSAFVERMKLAGFTAVGKKAGTVELKGDFAGFKNCRVAVSTLNNNDLVSYITVNMQKKENWRDLEADYRYLKDMLTEKYGKPSSCTERFEGGMEPDSDSDRYIFAQIGHCKYITVFSTDEGNVELSIVSHSMDVNLRLVYRDRINQDKIRETALNDL